MSNHNARQINRNRVIIIYHETNPDVSMKEIGRLFPNNGKPLSKQRIWAILTNKTCQNCYHVLAMGALCACREKSNMLKRDCPDWYSQKRRQSHDKR